jgi:hypothetical protein
MPELIVIGRKIALRYQFTQPIIVGRHIANALPLPDREISRRHAQLFPRDDQFFVADLGSRNGIYVNGTKFQERALAPGDEICLGMTILLFDPPADVAMVDLFSDRGRAIWERMPEERSAIPTTLSAWDAWDRSGLKHFCHDYPDRPTTYGAVELDARILQWLEGTDNPPLVPRQSRSNFLELAFKMDQYKTTEEMGKGVLTYLQERVGGQRWAIMSQSTEEHSLDLRALVSRKGSHPTDLIIDREVLNVAIEGRKAGYCTNCARDYRFHRLAQEASAPIGSFMVVPINCGGEAYGFAYAECPPGEESFDFQNLVESYIAVALLGKCLYWAQRKADKNIIGQASIYGGEEPDDGGEEAHEPLPLSPPAPPEAPDGPPPVPFQLG